MKKLAKIILILFVVGSILTFTATSLIIYKYSKELPDIANIIENYSPSLPSVVYDRNGKKIDVISKETREIANFNEIPKDIKDAFLAIEDKKFYHHHGIHFKRLLGAVIANIRSGKRSQGASSFTQQLARNAFLSHEKSISRKIKEALITFEIERKYTKDEIFEKYLNEIYFGGGAYGIKTAAHRFFRKEISQINLPEAAMLAGIPNRPETYSPSKHLKNAKKRMNLILSQMLKDDFITKEEYDKALKHQFINEKNLPKNYKENPNITVVYNSKNTVDYNVPDFSDLVVNELLKHFDEDTLYTKGLKIYTTLDLDIQKVAYETFNTYPLLKQEDMQGAMVTLDPNTGEVISIIAGKNYKAGDFNRATMARRQLGSSIKPFLYFTAIQNGYELNTIVEDRYLQYGDWIPKNYGSKYNRDMTLLTALDRSVNTVSIQLLANVGILKFQNNMKLLDKNLKIPSNLTAALGTSENTCLNQALDYSIFANGGYKIKPIFITSVIDKYGNNLYENKIEKEPIFDSLDTSIITYMLSSSVKYGSSWRARVYDKNKRLIAQGGKTGTTNDSRTLWYAGITPNYVTTIYLGYDDNREMTNKNSTGGGASAPLWGKYYQNLVNLGLYDTSSKFSFLDNYINSGVLENEYLTLYSGLREEKGRKFVIRRGKLEIEKNDKYKDGLGNIISNMGYNKGQVIEEKGSFSDPLLDRLLGN